MLSNQVVTSEEIPSPYVSLPRLTALVRYSNKRHCQKQYSLNHFPKVDGLNHGHIIFLGKVDVATIMDKKWLRQTNITHFLRMP